MKFLLSLVLFVCFAFMSCQKEIPVLHEGSSIRLNKSDSLVMVRFHESMGGFGWNLKDCNTWENVTFEYDPELNESFVVAFLGTVGFMKNKGEIPKEIGQLSRLRYFYVQDPNHKLGGEFPMEIFNCPLESLMVEADVHGTFTSEVGKIGNTIRYFYIQGTNMGGQLPREFGLFKNLRYQLVLGNNHFSGFLPKEFSSIKGGVILVQNEISTIEWEFFDIQRDKAWEVNLWDNHLSGEIPESVFETAYWKAFGNKCCCQKSGYGFSNYRD